MSVFEAGSSDRSPWTGALAILVTGVVLGLAYNAVRLGGERPQGLPWIAEDRMAALEAGPTVIGGEPAEPAPGGRAGASAGTELYYTDVSDPLAVPADPGADLPEIPDAGRPVQIELGALARYVERDAALVVDARAADEYAAGHVPGAVNLPYEQAVTDPALLESLETAGRPIITYCGGGTCEESLSLAWEIVGAGHARVAVYVGGWPEWVAAGHAVETGER